ncbi:MAG TPA: ATP-binding protein [Longimicrobiales bacterium]
MTAAAAILLAVALVLATAALVQTRRRAARSAAELEALRAELLDSTRLASLGNLVAGLVHEVNTPIGALVSNHDVLQRALARLQTILADERVDDHELQEVRKIVRAFDDINDVNTQAVQRIDHLVRNLRNFGRPDRSEIAWADLHEGLDSTLAIMRHELRDIQVVRDYGELPAVLCRPQQINQVFMNLLVNACQASPHDGRLHIRTRAEGQHALVTITDNGTGIPAELQARIFEPGFTTKGGRIGMGMGLLISRQIVEAHGGSIAVQSTPGRGAEFTVKLPVAPATLQRQSDQSIERRL